MASPEVKFRVYNDALQHAATCRIPDCQSHEGRCQKVRSSVNHFVNCYTQRRQTSRVDEIEECKHCAKIFGLLCFHAKICPKQPGEKCQVHMCDYLRQKIAQKIENESKELHHARQSLHENMWTVERRMAQAEHNRIQVFEEIRRIVIAKYARGEEIKDLYVKYLHD